MNRISARRRKKAPDPVVHDRRAVDALAKLHAVPVDVKDPHDLDGGVITVLASTRGDVLRVLHTAPKDPIDDAQFAAGRAWESDWQRAQVGHASSGGQWQERVSGGGVSGEILTDQVREAMRRLAKADRELGIIGCAIIRDILGRGFTFEACAVKYRGNSEDRAMRYIRSRFRECLESLVVVYQLGSAK
jgi:hypothetical protein